MCGKQKILAVASGGGHWVQLMRLKPAFDCFDVVWVSRDPSSSMEVSPSRFMTIGEASRSQKWATAKVCLQALWILIKIRPKVIVTTGALPGLILLAMGKFLFGAKTIWIDSIANVETLSGSGRVASVFADVCLTQWPDLEAETVFYWGSVI